MIRLLPRRLTVRLGLVLLFGAGLVLAAAGGWSLALHRTHLTRLLESRAVETAEVFRAATRDAMMRNNPEDVRRIIRTAEEEQPTIRRIRVFDKLGRITVSTADAEVGTLVDTAAEQCVSCHARGEPLTHLDRSDRARIFTDPAGERVLGVIAPINNETSCARAACHAHPPSQTVLGVLDVQLSLAEVDEHVAAAQRQMAWGIAGSILAMLVLTGLVTWRMVLRPVGRLKEATTRVARGDFSERIPVTSRDEIGDMTRSWNLMIDRLGQAHEELEQWSRTLERKVEDKTRELEEAHRQMLLVEKMASLGKLSAVVAHELNNPLTGIATYARLLRRRLGEAPEGGETRRILELVEDEAQRCGNIVRNLLLFSRAPSARFAETELAPLLERCVMLVRHKAELASVEVDARPAEDLPLVECDPSQVQQLLVALLVNAIEASPPESRVEVRAAAAGTGEEVILEVADRGHGIPEEALDRIFEPFYTTKEDGTREGGAGVGLGLAVVYGIVRRHGGSVDVASEPGVGTTFTVRLPVRRGAPEGGGGAAGEGGGKVS